jgi:hypothetical protein
MKQIKAITAGVAGAAAAFSGALTDGFQAQDVVVAVVAGVVAWQAVYWAPKNAE